MLLSVLLYCRDDTSRMTGHFEGYVEVKSKDEVAVMEALMKHGPLAVGVDASFEEFLFYRYALCRQASLGCFCNALQRWWSWASTSVQSSVWYDAAFCAS